ncbi:NAD(P)-dependent dehydrogenase (short-subunit alcohol dehydrogenase family) [Litorivivens lipolytica]|uniref:NAD(P)-dependent dehydrogenase (Short-subunit alcohol dehydrogenase family) n=1 Tax=Litorivivens lipolytica TaxID=1524264 RepID=A0A7W4W5K9_9GAMM|nr:SDR family oxidoreductase [Litorivivens lipolytica]MBB3047859.1 NAD(P)-dependent dehydrogenase (short-subunit alcohol dehydrogenase family) [Litorivivens lipolytica]
MSRPVAFITGASRGIGAATALAFAREGYDLVLTARTLKEGEQHEYGSWQSTTTALPGSLESTAAAAKEFGSEVLLVRSDILDTASVLAAADKALDHFGRVDVLFNNACYQGPGNMQRVLEVELEQVEKIYRGNVLTPLALAQKLLPGMLERKAGAVINMVSGSALNDPPAPADEGGWGFAYPSSKAALIRMMPSLRVEHKDSGIRFFSVEPGFVLTEVMKANGFDDKIAARFNPTPPESIADIVYWLASSEAALEHHHRAVIFAPQLHKKLFGEDK